jgi:hypothetical protein
VSAILFLTALCSPLPQGPGFEPPVRLAAAGAPIRVEAPGYAAPSWHDVDRDGVKDLVVGQFREGRIAWYRNLGKGSFAERAWLQAGGKDAVVPGVW